MSTLYEILSFTESLGRESGELILKRSGERGFSIREKGNIRNLVTSSDLEAEKLIADRIKVRFPDHLILSEESWPSLSAKDLQGPVWIVDPIDGTTNFSRGIPGFCVSIAFADQGEILCGVVNAPAIHEFYSAKKGDGAKLNQQQIKASSCTAIESAIVSTGFPYARTDLIPNITKQIEFVLSECSGLRRFGAAAIDLCWVAAGKLDAHFEFRLNLWDLAAGILIGSEAGATIGGFAVPGETRKAETTIQCDKILVAAPGIYQTIQTKLSALSSS